MFTKITQAMFAGKNSAHAQGERDMEKNEKSKNSTSGRFRKESWINRGKPNSGTKPRRQR